MTQTQVRQQIKEGVETSKRYERICKVYFKLRTPMIGFFTALHDDEELAAKGMVRFVPGGKEELFHATRQTMWTRIFVVSDFIDLQFV